VQVARQALLADGGAADEAALHERIDGQRRWQAAQACVDALDIALDAALAGVPHARDDLARATCEQLQADIHRCDARLAELGPAAAEAAARRRELERRGAEDPSTALAELRLEREAVLAELADLARVWQVQALAAALLEGARHEYIAAEQHGLFRAASHTISALTDGRYTALVRTRDADDLAVLDRDGRRLPLGPALGEPLLTQVRLSLLLGAARAPGGERSRPVVLDDVLATVPLDAAAPVVREIAAVVRTHPVCYLTTRAGRARTRSALAAAVPVHELDAP
jgi:uncharacterized protein YhaN